MTWVLLGGEKLDKEIPKGMAREKMLFNCMTAGLEENL